MASVQSAKRSWLQKKGPMVVVRTSAPAAPELDNIVLLSHMHHTGRARYRNNCSTVFCCMSVLVT